MSKPQVCLELEQMIQQHRITEALILLRRESRCSSQEGRLFLSELAQSRCDWRALARKFPSIVAPLCDDPAPELLRRLAPHRRELLRYLRRGRRLQALRLVQEQASLDLTRARLFCASLEKRAHCWNAVVQRYEGANQKDFFEAWPPPDAEPRPSEEGLFSEPAEFDHDVIRQRIEVGDIATAVRLVRRHGFVELETARAFVDRFEDLLLERGGDAWWSLRPEYPQLVAALEGEPDPQILQQMKPLRSRLDDFLTRGRKLEALRLVQATTGATSQGARRFLERIGNAPRLDSVSGAPSKTPPAAPVRSPVRPPSQPRPIPVPPQAAVAAPAVPKVVPELVGAAGTAKALPELQGAAPGASVVTAPPPAAKPAPPPSKPVAPPSPVAAPAAKPVAAAPPPPPPPSAVPPPVVNISQLSELQPFLDPLVAALERGADDEARAIFANLRQSGFDRNWLTKQAPLLHVILPAEPWEEQLRQVLPFLRNLRDWSRAGAVPEALFNQPLAQVSREVGDSIDFDDLEAVYDDVRDFVKTGNFAELEPSLTKILATPRGEQELRERVPQLDELFRDQPITIKALKAFKAHPENALIELLRRKNPKLLEQIHTEKLHGLVNHWPQLKDWMKRGQLHKASVFLFKELGLRPSDISTFIKVVREIL